jgi:hypothetical protein
MLYEVAFRLNDCPTVEELTPAGRRAATPARSEATLYKIDFRLKDPPTREEIIQELMTEAFDESGGQWVPVYLRHIPSGVLLLTPAEQPEAPEAGKEAPPVDWEALAIGVLVKNPGWTVQQVADHVGVHRGTLYRSSTFKAFRARIRAGGKQEFLRDLPRGTKEVDPDDPRAGARLEAWCERDDDDDE